MMLRLVITVCDFEKREDFKDKVTFSSQVLMVAMAICVY